MYKIANKDTKFEKIIGCFWNEGEMWEGVVLDKLEEVNETEITIIKTKNVVILLEKNEILETDELSK